MGDLKSDDINLRRVSPEARVLLDVVRSLAAVYVVIHHVALHVGLTGVLAYPLRFGQEAVMVFFLLSGFLIFASESSRTSSGPRAYYLRRLRRIYPLLALAFVLSALVAWSNGTLLEDFSLRELLANIFALQDIGSLKPGVMAEPFLGNSPLWSLSYEVAFYAAFPLMMKLRRRSRRFALTSAGLVAIAGYASYLALPNHFSLVAAYFLVWWAGAYLADLYRSRVLSVRTAAPLFAWLVTVTALSALGVSFYEYAGIGVFPVLPLRHFVFAIVCIALAMTPLVRVALRTSVPLARPAAYVASISYGLYVFHYPLLVQWDFAQAPIGLAMASILLVAASIVGDRLLDRVLPKPGQTQRSSEAGSLVS